MGGSKLFPRRRESHFSTSCKSSCPTRYLDKRSISTRKGGTEGDVPALSFRAIAKNLIANVLKMDKMLHIVQQTASMLKGNRVATAHSLSKGRRAGKGKTDFMPVGMMVLISYDEM